MANNIRRQHFYRGLRHAARQVPFNIAMAAAVTGFTTGAAESEVLDKPAIAAFAGIVTSGMVAGAFIGDVCNWTMNGRTITEYQRSEPEAFSPQFLRPLTDAQETVHVGHAQGALFGAFLGGVIALQTIALPAEAQHRRMMEVFELTGRQAELVLALPPPRRVHFSAPKIFPLP